MKLESEPNLLGILEHLNFAQRVNERCADIDAQRPEMKSDINAWAPHLTLSQVENAYLWQTIGTYVGPNPVVYDIYEEV